LAKSIRAPGQPVDLVDHHHVDQPALDVRQQAAQCRPLQGAAGDAAVVVAVGHQHPALGALAGDIGLARLALGVEGVELHVEPQQPIRPRVQASLIPAERNSAS
jgi:hypothetical protein